MPGVLVPPSEAEVRLSRISETVSFCEVQTRREMRRGKTQVVQDGYLPGELKDAARTILLGGELTDSEQKALDQISQIFPEKPVGHYSFDFIGTRFIGKGYDLILETTPPDTYISGVWDIAPFGTGNEIFERTWQRANAAPGDKITSLELAEDETLYLIHPDGKHSAAVDFASILLSAEQVLCVRPENLNALIEEEPAKAASAHERPKLKSEVQKEAILATLRDQLNLDPLNLPLRKAGRNPGPKAQCRDILISNNQLFTEESFKTAWKNLRASGEINGGD